MANDNYWESTFKKPFPWTAETDLNLAFTPEKDTFNSVLNKPSESVSSDVTEDDLSFTDIPDSYQSSRTEEELSAFVEDPTSKAIYESVVQNQNQAGSDAVDQTKKLSQWAAAKGDWGARAGIIADVATHAGKLVSILDGSWAESQKKIIGMGKYHGPGRAWWA